MIVRTQTGLVIEIQETGRFIMAGTDGDVVAYTARDAIEVARALLIAAGIVPTPQAQGYDSFSLPPDETAIGMVTRG